MVSRNALVLYDIQEGTVNGFFVQLAQRERYRLELTDSQALRAPWSFNMIEALGLGTCTSGQAWEEASRGDGGVLMSRHIQVLSNILCARGAAARAPDSGLRSPTFTVDT